MILSVHSIWADTRLDLAAKCFSKLLFNKTKLRYTVEKRTGAEEYEISAMH